MKSIVFTILVFIGWNTAFIQAQPSALDSTFGVDGKVITPIGTGSEVCNAMTLLPDGKIVAVGRKHNGLNYDFFLISYLGSGALDSSFGNAGKVLTSFGSNEITYTVAVQPNGRIVTAGTSYNMTGSVITLIRYYPTGLLDPTFGLGGRKTVSFGTSDHAVNSIALQPDGKILMAGEYDYGNSVVALARFEPNGALDTTFGVGGKVTTDVFAEPGRDVAESVALQPDGRILVAGWTRHNEGTIIDFLLLRYHSDGTPDSTFGVNGQVITDFGDGEDVGVEVVLQPDGKIVVAGSTRPTPSQGLIALARYLPNGELDPDFGTAGKVTAAFGLSTGANSVALQPDGKIVTGGGVSTGSGGNPDFAVARFNPDGTLDSTFGTGGQAIADFDPYVSFSAGIALQPDGKIVQAGMYAPENLSTGGFALSRYLPGLTLGVVDFSAGLNDVLLYPNPLRENATLEYTLARDERLTLALYDPAGRLVKTFFSGQKRSRGEHREHLVVDDFRSPGNYVLVLTNGYGRASVKINRL